MIDTRCTEPALFSTHADRASDLDVGIVYTNEPWIQELLATVAGSARGTRLRTIVVNNGSSASLAEWPAKTDTPCVIHRPRRHTYADNLNTILESSRSRYVLLLNTDMFFDPEEQCLAKMIRFMDSHPDCGVASCRLYHPDGSYAHSARRLPNLRSIAARRLPHFGWLNDALDSYLCNDCNATTSFDCDWISGCFLMVRRAALATVGPFDTRFKKYFEDVDFCQRMWQQGWRVMLHGKTYAYHYEQRASRRVLSLDAWRHLESYRKWVWKWHFGQDRRPALAAARAWGRSA